MTTQLIKILYTNALVIIIILISGCPIHRQQSFNFHDFQIDENKISYIHDKDGVFLISEVDGRRPAMGNFFTKEKTPSVFKLNPGYHSFALRYKKENFFKNSFEYSGLMQINFYTEAGKSYVLTAESVNNNIKVYINELK